MIDLGLQKPGKTIRIPFPTFSAADGSQVTVTNFTTADILIYKDGSTTERASTSGYTATTDFDSKTGKHVITIDLSDNTTAGFFSAGSEYLVAIDSITVGAVNTGDWVARFEIGYTDAILNTTIATLSSQTSFTLTVGPAEDDALNGRQIVLHDIASAVQVGMAVISDYTGSTKTVTLAAATTFTIAAGDNVAVLGLAPLQPTTTGNKLDVTATGAAGIDWGNIENQGTSAIELSGTSIASVDGSIGGDIAGKVLGGGAGAIFGVGVNANVTEVSGDSTAADNLESYLDGTEFLPVDAYKVKFSVSGATLTVKKPDGTTTAYTKTLTTDAAAIPVIGN